MKAANFPQMLFYNSTNQANSCSIFLTLEKRNEEHSPSFLANILPIILQFCYCECLILTLNGNWNMQKENYEPISITKLNAEIDHICWYLWIQKCVKL